MIISMLLLTACKEEGVNSSYYVIEDIVSTPEPKEEQELLIAEKTIFKLFYPDETGQVMLTKMIEVEQIDKVSLIENILDLGYLDENTRLIKLSGDSLEDGSRILVAEFSEELKNTLEKMEESKAHILFGCIVNTLLDAYDAVGVRVLSANEDVVMRTEESNLDVNEGDLPDGYYSAFALADAINITRDVMIQEEIETITYERFYTEEGYSIFFEKDNYTSGYNQSEGLVVFENLDFTTTMSIYVSESSKADTVQILTDQLELGVEEVAETQEMEIGVGAYETTGIFKRGKERIYNYYVIEEKNQVFVIEVRMDKETSIEQGAHIAYMLDTFQIW